MFLSLVMFGLDGDALETKTRVKIAAHELNKNIMFYLHISALPTGGITKTFLPSAGRPGSGQSCCSCSSSCWDN